MRVTMEYKTRVTYKPTDSYTSPILPTKSGSIYFEFRPIKLDQSWLPKNSVSRGKEGNDSVY